MGNCSSCEGPVSTCVGAHPISAGRVRQTFVPGNIQAHKNQYQYAVRAKLQWDLAGERMENVFEAATRVPLQTYDGIELDAVWVQAGDVAVRPTALLFHGNAMTLHSMAGWANFYYRIGFHALLITMRGYPGSAGDAAADGEVGFYRDAAAAVAFIQEKKGIPKNIIVAHGFSLGATLAAAAASQHDLGALVLDHAFTTPAAVAKMFVPRLPEWLLNGTMVGAWRSGLTAEVAEGKAVITDGLSNIEKVGNFRGLLCVIYGTEDEMMPVSFAESLLSSHEAHTGDAKPSIGFPIEGGTHNTPQFYESVVQESLEEVLQQSLAVGPSTVLDNNGG